MNLNNAKSYEIMRNASDEKRPLTPCERIQCEFYSTVQRHAEMLRSHSQTLEHRAVDAETSAFVLFIPDMTDIVRSAERVATLREILHNVFNVTM